MNRSCIYVLWIKTQLTLEKHGFELRGSIYMLIFSLFFLFSAALGLSCGMGDLFVVARGLLSSCGVWGFFSLSSCGTWAPGRVGSVVCGTWAL